MRAPAQPEIKERERRLNFFAMNKALCKSESLHLFRQVVANYEGLVVTGRSPAIVHAADS